MILKNAVKNLGNGTSKTLAGMTNELREDIAIDLGRTDNRLIYGATLGSIALSLFMTRKDSKWATFTGLWAPTILALGILLKENKLLKLEQRKLLGIR